MPKQKRGASPPKKQQSKSADGRGQRGQRVTNKVRPSLIRSIASAVVIKDEDLCFLSEHDGRVPLGVPHGVGLYYHDCRFLNGYELHLADGRPETLVAAAPHGYKAQLVLTNPDMRLADGRLFQKEDLAIEWERIIDSGSVALRDQITLLNFSMAPGDAAAFSALRSGV